MKHKAKSLIIRVATRHSGTNKTSTRKPSRALDSVCIQALSPDRSGSLKPIRLEILAAIQKAIQLKERAIGGENAVKQARSKTRNYPELTSILGNEETYALVLLDNAPLPIRTVKGQWGDRTGKSKKWKNWQNVRNANQAYSDIHQLASFLRFIQCHGTKVTTLLDGENIESHFPILAEVEKGENCRLIIPRNRQFTLRTHNPNSGKTKHPSRLWAIKEYREAFPRTPNALDRAMSKAIAEGEPEASYTSSELVPNIGGIVYGERNLKEALKEHSGWSTADLKRLIWKK